MSPTPQIDMTEAMAEHRDEPNHSQCAIDGGKITAVTCQPGTRTPKTLKGYRSHFSARSLLKHQKYFPMRFSKTGILAGFIVFISTRSSRITRISGTLEIPLRLGGHRLAKKPNRRLAAESQKHRPVAIDPPGHPTTPFTFSSPIEVSVMPWSMRSWESVRERTTRPAPGFPGSHGPANLRGRLVERGKEIVSGCDDWISGMMSGVAGLRVGLGRG